MTRKGSESEEPRRSPRLRNRDTQVNESEGTPVVETVTEDDVEESTDEVEDPGSPMGGPSLRDRKEAEYQADSP